jgi:osmoprotectant transport system permease protein
MSYLLSHPGAVFEALLQHVELAGTALAIAVVVALPIGIVLARARTVRPAALALLGAVYAVPSLALFALLVPSLGLGFAPAVTGLAAYAIVILINSVVAGIVGVDPAVVESARGIGMNGAQVLWRVEFPLALPVIVGGLRVAAVAVIFIASIAALVDAGGLGTLILAGIDQNNLPKAIAGTVACVALALVVDGLLRLTERRLRTAD